MESRWMLICATRGMDNGKNQDGVLRLDAAEIGVKVLLDCTSLMVPAGRLASLSWIQDLCALVATF